MTGIVYLVGAGPGDYRLLTLRGKDLLCRADVVVYDYLADKRLLDFAPKAAEIIYVGKKAKLHTLPQDDINTILIEKAQLGKKVVRLKGGDPFVFGRGGEEALALKNAGIPFEVVPGITSAIAVPAYAGIPVTNRNTASSFAVITGHEDPAKETSSIQWDKLATGVDTLVFLMGIHHLPTITEKLIEHGRPADTPAALIRWGTKANQETLVTTLGSAAEDAKKHHLRPPAIFMVGPVVDLRKDLRWFDNKLLFGKTVAVTRTHTQAAALTETLEELGANCIEVPTIRITQPLDDYTGLDEALGHIQSYDWIIFTSTNGVDAFFQRLRLHRLDSRSLGHAKLAVIGSATEKALAQHGLLADIIPADYRAEGLVDTLQEHIGKGSRVLIPRAREARSYLQDGLRAIGADVDVVESYCTVAALENKERFIQLLQDKTIDMITFTSSSTVTSLIEFLDGNTELLKGITFACIGPITAHTCEEYHLFPTIVADTYTVAGLAEKIREWSMTTHEA